MQLGGSWVDFPVDTAKALEDAYQAKKPDVTLPPQRGACAHAPTGAHGATACPARKGGE